MRGVRAACRAAWHQTRSGITSLSGSPRDLWIVFILKVLESYNYFSLSRSLALFLTEEFGVSDYRAGFWYGVWGTLLTAYGFLLGGAIDVLGVRRSLVLSFLLNCTSRFVMASTQSRTMLLVMLLGPNTAASALGIPVMTIGIKRYTHDGNRGFAFALFYSLMNIAALSQGVVMDVFRIGFKHGFRIASLPDHSLLNSGSRLFLASGCVTSLAGLLISFLLKEGAAPAPKRSDSEAQDLLVHSQRSVSAELELPASPDAPLLDPAPGGSSGSKNGAEGHAARHRSSQHGGRRDKAGRTLGGDHGEGESHLPLGNTGDDSGGSSAVAGGLRRSMSELLAGVGDMLSSRGFWKFLVMCIITVNLKAVFRHLDATLPKYQLRAFGCDTPIGLIYSINPAMIVLLVPIVGAMTTEFPHFDMIHYGGYVSALSPFWIVAFNTEWSTAVFVAMLSLGEAIWSPRWYDYSMSVAPNGREGIFTALASAPLFAAMLPTGMISGALLQRYCPDHGQCTSHEDSSGGGGGGSNPARRLLAWLHAESGGSGSGGEAVSHSGWGGRLLAALGGGPPPPGGYECDGRAMWTIVGLLTLSSPLLVLLLQRWVRPAPGDFAKLDAPHACARTPNEGECFDVNAADPTEVLENVYEASLLHAAEHGGAGPAGGGGVGGSAGVSQARGPGARD